MLARILLAHVAPSCLTDTEPPAIDTPALDLIGGLHGARWYTRTSDRFAMDRPSWGGMDDHARRLVMPAGPRAALAIGAA